MTQFASCIAAGLLGFSALAGLVETSARAQAETIEIADDAVWAHEWTGITIEPSVKGYSRTSVKQYVPDQMNVGIQLWDEGKNTSITVYIYRAGAANVSIWADRAVTALLANPALGKPVDGEFFMGRFTPTKASGTDSGFHAVTPLQGAETKASGLSIFAHDDWLIKVRASSATLSETEITQTIGSIITSLGLGKSKTTYPAVQFIEPCEKPLKFSKKVKLTQLDLMGQLVFTPLTDKINVASMGKAKEDEAWCRDPQSVTEVGIYRTGGSKNDYIAAIGDSGTNAYVSKFSTSSELMKAKGYLVKTSDGVEERTWPLFDKFPHPIVIARNIGTVGPLATLDVKPGSDGDTTIFVSPESIPD